MKLKFITSAADIRGCPQDPQPEIAIMGRSNAGKSSFLNALCGKNVAKVSQQPGKTRLLNFFQAGEFYRWVDMPGYGFAAVSGSEQKAWHALVENFLVTRGNLAGGILVMDIRRKWTDDEQSLVDLFQSLDLPLAVVLNKEDKVRSGELVKARRKTKALEGIDMVFTTSALKRKGHLQVEDYIFKNWIRPGLESDQS